jgi:hypothetical protein
MPKLKPLILNRLCYHESTLRIVIAWASFWAFTTALIGFIAGKVIWKFVEHSINWDSSLFVVKTLVHSSVFTILTFIITVTDILKLKSNGKR